MREPTAGKAVNRGRQLLLVIARERRKLRTREEQEEVSGAGIKIYQIMRSYMQRINPYFSYLHTKSVLKYL